MIYFIRTSEGDPIKIGVSIRLAMRLAQHRMKWPNMELLGVHEGNEEVEASIHARFDHLRLPSCHKRRAGKRPELFYPESDLLDYIRAHCHLPSQDDLESGKLLPNVRVDSDIVAKARFIATDKRVDLAVYLSESLRTVVERDWAKMVLEMDRIMGGEKTDKGGHDDDPRY